jgi:M6 family metalloprotease-like protein
MSTLTRCLPVAVLVIISGWALCDEPAESLIANPRDPRVVDAGLPDLSEFRTVDTAVTARISRAVPEGAVSQPGYLGVHLESRTDGLVVADVEPHSPAAKAGLRPGDLLRDLAGQTPRSLDVLGDVLRARSPGDQLKLQVLRDDAVLELTATLAATSRPLNAAGPRASLGVFTSEAADGAKVERIVNDSPAAAAGIKTGDVITKIDGADISSPERIQASIGDKRPGDEVAVILKREGKDVELKVKLSADQGFGRGGRGGGWDTRQASLFRRDAYRLAVVLIEYPDVKHSPKISTFDWEQALFSRGVYFDKSPTGQQVYGSLNDYYLEQSCGAFRVEGKVFDWITANKKRSDYTNDPNRFALLTESLDKLLSRDGKEALKDFDGIFFVYAGDRVQTNRGGLYWPHRASVSHQGKRWGYFICPDGAGRFSSISVIAHEFGHMLGLPDLYARPESPGSEGLGVWCTMSTGHGRDGKPLHMSSWCKEQLGWLKPTVIDPTVKQKLVLGPIESSSKECFKVLIRADGSEYLLLENRLTRGYDRDLPAEGLLIWRVVDGRPVLEESHGIAGPDGPQRFLGSVPYPSKSNTAFTPYTTPSSKPQKGGGLPVHITNIRKLQDGRVTFYIGYEYL